MSMNPPEVCAVKTSDLFFYRTTAFRVGFHYDTELLYREWEFNETTGTEIPWSYV